MKTSDRQLEAEMASVTDRQNMPEKTGYTRYYEHDGMLRAYANRSMVLAMVFGVIFSLVVGIGLMALLFYSSRKGYDEPAVLIEDSRADRDD